MSGVLFRCDGGRRLGLGHVIRCLALADALRKQGTKVAFAMWPDEFDAVNRIHDAGIEMLPMAVPRDRLGRLNDLDAQRVQESARRIHADWIIVDHYQAGSDYLKQLRANGFQVGVIDDLADRDLTAVDWILNPNLAAGELTYQTGSDCTICRGPEFAVLRRSFASARESLNRSFSPDDRNVLITLGGSDVTEQVAALVSALNHVSQPLVICAVLGSASDAKRLTPITTSSRHEFSVMSGVSDMSDLMAWADVSINAGGTTCWEMCCLGLPMVVSQLSDDQAANVRALSDRELAVGLGQWDENHTPAASAAAVSELLASPDRRAAMSRRGMALVDGRGARRAGASLLSVARQPRRMAV